MTVPTTPDAAFWKGKRVLLTGHTGFKGAWLSIWLQHLGADVIGLSLAPATQPNLFELAGHTLTGHHTHDIRDAAGTASLISDARPDIVLHLAAQALVRPSYKDPLGTFETNVMGTANVLDAVRATPSVRAVMAITTDKVYRNLEHAYPYRETDHLGGHDPYSASKAASEIVISSYRDSYLRAQGVAVASARAGNVIGGGDWSEDRLLPDAVRAWQSGAVLQVRRPDATRPWQHVLEPLSGYLVLAERLWSAPDLAESFNFGPSSHEAASVQNVIEIARRAYGRGEVRYGNGTEGPHEASWLALETAKARHTLGVEPRWSLSDAVTRSMRWYRAQSEGADALELCLADIRDYESLS
jgi:CDP-glucose 4,6-dehydratase